MVKRLPTTWESRVQSLGQEESLEKEMATHSSTLAWKIPWTEERGKLQSMGSQRVRHDWLTSLHFILILSYKINGYNKRWSSSYDSALLMQGAQVWSLVRQLEPQGSSRPRNQSQVSDTSGRLFTILSIRDARTRRQMSQLGQIKAKTKSCI